MRRMRRTRIFTPGPTPVAPSAQLAMASPLVHHRKDEFRELLLETRNHLQALFRTRSDVVILTASGTGAMEASVSNLLSSESRALAVSAGKFGDRWVQICRAFNVPCEVLEKPYGEAASALEIQRALEANPDIRALLIQGCESSTATIHDLESISRMVRTRFPDVLVVVDAITALGSQPVETDAWGLDVVIGGAQKAFAIPPGLSFLSLSSRALAAIRACPGPRFYFDLLKEVKGQRRGQTGLTPAVALVQALNRTSREMVEQGLDRILEQVEVRARCTRRGLEALGFRQISSAPANALTACYPPAGIDAARLIQSLQERFGIVVAGGQGVLKGKIIRIGHLGYFDLVDVFAVISSIEICLLELGARIDLGAGIRAAMQEAVTPVFSVQPRIESTKV